MMRKKNNIRVGLIRCDQRALWYGAIFDNINPDVYARLSPAAYHHFTYYAHVELQHKRSKGYELVKLYDPDKQAAQRVADAFDNRPAICASLEEISEDVDLVFIANALGDGRDHLKLATPGLRKGVPTFIDSPFAYSVRDAREMVELAKENQAPVLSCSHMCMLPHASRFRQRFAEIGPVESGVIHGPDPAQVADSIELALFLFGEEFGGCAESVCSMGKYPLEILLIRFANADESRVLQALIVNSRVTAPRNAFFVTATSSRMPVHADDIDAFIQPEGGLQVMDMIKRMLRTGKPPLPYEMMIEPVAVAEASRKAYAGTKSVKIEHSQTKK